MRKPPQKKLYSYLIPFLILALVFGIVIYFITSSGAISFGAGAPAYLEVQNPDVKVLLKNNDNWRSVPEKVNIKLFHGDSIKTNADGEAKVQLLKDSFAYLDHDTLIEIQNLNESDSFQKTTLGFTSGKILVKAERIINPKSNFIISYERLRLDTRGATFVLSTDLLQVLEGKVVVEKIEKEKVYTSLEVGIGQQLNLTETTDGAFHELAAINSEVYASPFIERALGKTLNSPSDIVKTSESSISTSTENTPEKKNTNSQNSGTVMNPVSTETRHSLSISNLTGNTESIIIQEKEYEIKGTVSEGAEKITVNDYTLSKFKKGNTEWSYRARTDLGNLKEGKNIFEVTAYFPNDVKITKSITVNYQAKSSTTNSISEISDTKLEVISPKDGESVSTDPVIIRGTAPDGTVKVVIDDYVLRSFKAGDAQWKYTASQQFGNLKAGETNKYLVTAYDKDGKQIASVSFQFLSTATVLNTTTTTSSSSTSVNQ